MSERVDLGGVTQEAGDISDPAAGLRAVARLRQVTEAIELRQVEAALETGMSWADIAGCLGVSRQAVHKKYRSRVRPELVRGRSKA
ncbi:hypothetical protein [Ornithinimicrobium pratense]|uniref:RNA polymerase subunit sigma-70 n=1 Tax=Ornithinimicrobium pratense TaxID=2593973 RepID=A0A5J6V4R1_9MICO|nr:hypothetical protein [Ornithinimicrobium pratense]QFG68577.1 hypothetical protein FY030_07475 [Ornithinimicrobium pratense]